MTEPRFPHTTMHAGNIFEMGGAIGRMLRRADVPREEIDAFYAELHASQNYDAALDVCGKWVTVLRDEEEEP